MGCADILLVECVHFEHVTRSAHRGRFAPAGLASRALSGTVIVQNGGEGGGEHPPSIMAVMNEPCMRESPVPYVRKHFAGQWIELVTNWAIFITDWGLFTDWVSSHARLADPIRPMPNKIITSGMCA